MENPSDFINVDHNKRISLNLHLTVITLNNVTIFTFDFHPYPGSASYWVPRVKVILMALREVMEVTE